jgi:hypothetical protein
MDRGQVAPVREDLEQGPDDGLEGSEASSSISDLHLSLLPPPSPSGWPPNAHSSSPYRALIPPHLPSALYLLIIK